MCVLPRFFTGPLLFVSCLNDGTVDGDGVPKYVPVASLAAKNPIRREIVFLTATATSLRKLLADGTLADYARAATRRGANGHS